MPPTGFLGLGGTPTCAGACSRSIALDDSSRVCVARVACRAIKVQLRVAVEAITRNYSVGHSVISSPVYFGNYFAARASRAHLGFGRQLYRSRA
jgi:hypothetical protein